MIETFIIVKIFATVSGCWAMGFSMGKSVAWVRHIHTVA